MPLIPPAGRFLALCLLAAVFTAACRTVEPPPNPLADTAWALRALVQDGDSLTQADGLPADLMLFQADGGFRSRSCNNCVGNYVLSDLHVVVRDLACTRRACPTSVLELDRYVAGRAGYEAAPDQLVLSVDDPINGIEARLYFAPAPPGAWE